jgi:hypothetical protein
MRFSEHLNNMIMSGGQAGCVNSAKAGLWLAACTPEKKCRFIPADNTLPNQVTEASNIHPAARPGQPSLHYQTGPSSRRSRGPRQERRKRREQD